MTKTTAKNWGTEITGSYFISSDFRTGQPFRGTNVETWSSLQLEEVMEKGTYKKAKLILEKYDSEKYKQ
jgi:hypothetical protein